MAGAASAPPLGVVIQQADGSNSMWNGKNWVPAAQGGDGSWAVDQAKLASMGLNQAGATLSGADQKQVQSLQSSADALDQAAGTTSDFMQRNARTNTGGVLALPVVGGIAKALGVGGDDLAAMDRDSTSLATSLRAPGQRLTQMEFLQNLRSGPTTKNAFPDNAAAAQQVYNANTMAQAKASFFTSYLTAKRTLNGAIPAWESWKAQHFGADGSYSHDPITNQQAAGAALKARSASGGTPAMLQPSDYLNQDDD